MKFKIYFSVCVPLLTVLFVDSQEEPLGTKLIKLDDWAKNDPCSSVPPNINDCKAAMNILNDASFVWLDRAPCTKPARANCVKKICTIYQTGPKYDTREVPYPFKTCVQSILKNHAETLKNAREERLNNQKREAKDKGVAASASSSRQASLPCLRDRSVLSQRQALSSYGSGKLPPLAKSVTTNTDCKHPNANPKYKQRGVRNGCLLCAHEKFLETDPRFKNLGG